MKIYPVLMVITSVLFSAGCSVFYVIKQGGYQLALLAQAEPIEIALRSQDIDLVTRKKLQLVLDVRQFAKSHLALTIDRNYKDVNLTWHHALFTVSASDPLQFKPYQWWFPIIGSVPYKGFFDERDAKQQELKLKALGFDTQRGKISGYSTLGYFADPIWPSMLTLADDDLIELILHELTHRTVYVPNQTPFNETLANFIGKVGVRAYLAHRFGDADVRVHNFDDRLRRQAIFRDFFYQLYAELDQLYKSDLPNDLKKTTKTKALMKAQTRYDKLADLNHLTPIDWLKVNNAYLMSYKRYNHDEASFDKLLQRMNGDFKGFFDQVRVLGSYNDPFSRLSTLVNKLDQPL